MQVLISISSLLPSLSSLSFVYWFSQLTCACVPSSSARYLTCLFLLSRQAVTYICFVVMIIVLLLLMRGGRGGASSRDVIHCCFSLSVPDSLSCLSLSRCLSVSTPPHLPPPRLSPSPPSSIPGLSAPPSPRPSSPSLRLSPPPLSQHPRILLLPFPSPFSPTSLPLPHPPTPPSTTGSSMGGVGGGGTMGHSGPVLRSFLSLKLLFV